MKRLIFVFIFICLSINAFGAEPQSEKGWITRFGELIDGKSGKCECPACPVLESGVVCPDTPVKEIKRPPFELEARLDGFVTPTGGTAQFSGENFTFVLKHNFSAVLNVYGSYSIATVDKTEYENSLYDKTWNYQTVIAGVGWYVHQIIEIHAGAGKTITKNSEGSETLGVTIEYGIKAHWAINTLGYKFIVGLVTREAPLAEEGTDIARSPADASANYIYAGVALPVGW